MFYEELAGVSKDVFIKCIFIIYEHDSEKGDKIIYYDITSDSIYR